MGLAAGAYGSTLNGTALSSTGGLQTSQIPHYDPPSGNAYLARLQMQMTGANYGVVYLVDRLWTNGGIDVTSTGAQTIVSPTWPARDATGTTSGVGVMLGIEVSATMGAATPTITIAYTNSAGAGSHSASNFDSAASGMVAPCMMRVALQAGDIGVQSVQSVTLNTSWISGTINLVAYRVLASIEMPMGFLTYAIDAVTGGFPQLFNGAVPHLIGVFGAAVSTNVICSYTETQG